MRSYININQHDSILSKGINPIKVDAYKNWLRFQQKNHYRLMNFEDEEADDEQTKGCDDFHTQQDMEAAENAQNK